MTNVVAKEKLSFEDLDTTIITEAITQVLKPAYRVYSSHESLIKDVTTLLYDSKTKGSNLHAICAEYLLRIRSFFIDNHSQQDKTTGEVFTDRFWMFPIQQLINTCDECIKHLSYRANFTKEYESAYLSAEILFIALKRTCTYSLHLHENKG